jgi:hypothetical protein
MLGEAWEFAAAVCPGARGAQRGSRRHPPVWVADVDVETSTLVHVEWVPDPSRSPLIEGSAAPDVVRSAALVDLLAVFARYRRVIEDPGNPLRGVRIITNRREAIPGLSWVHNEAGCHGAVEVRAADG